MTEEPQDRRQPPPGTGNTPDRDPPARMRARGSAKRSELEEARLLGFTQGAATAVALLEADWGRPLLRRWVKSLEARQERREAAKRGRERVMGDAE